MNWSLIIPLSPLLLLGCSSRASKPVDRPASRVESILTDIGAAACKTEVDKQDPNETTYLSCSGTAGYGLIVRRVEAGRESIEIVDPSGHVFPLNYQETVTRHMFSLGGKAEWRLATVAGKPVPIALIARVEAHEDDASPQQVTHTFLAIAKIGVNEACVVASLPEGAVTDDEVKRTADSAADRKCVSALPAIR